MDRPRKCIPKHVALATLVKELLAALSPTEGFGKTRKREPTTSASLRIEEEILIAILDVSPPTTKRLSDARKSVLNEKQRASFDFICLMCFRKICCGAISMQELANELHKASLDSLRDEHLLSLVVRLPHKEDAAMGGRYQAVHPLVEKFLAAVHLIQRPLMEIFEFACETLPTSDGGWTLLTVLSGLSHDHSWNQSVRGALPEVLKCLWKLHQPMANQPVIASHEFFHILDCIAESQNKELYRMLLQEFLTARTLVLRDEEVALWVEILVPFVLHSLPGSEHWTVLCDGGTSKPEVAELQRRVMAQHTLVLVRNLGKLANWVEKDLVIITTRKEDYLKDTLVPILQLRLSHKDSQHAAEKRQPSAQEAPFSVGGVPSRPSSYGYLTQDDYRSRMKLKSSAHFNMAKSALLPHITPYSTQPVQGQYRKNDHLWFSFSRNLRHDWYTTVRTTPNVPTHWVKVAQPNGSDELEARVKVQARAQVDSGSKEMVEFVLLNSQPLDLVEIASPSSQEEPVTIAIQGNVQSHDQGIIGCDYLLEKYDAGEKPCFMSHPFDIKRDERIVRCLPLPPKKAELSVSSISTATEGQGGAQGQPVPDGKRQRAAPDLSPASLGAFVPKHTQRHKAAAAAAAAEADEVAVLVSEHQVKTEASNGFDTPGYCFFGDDRLFVVRRVYPLPDSLSTCRVLREGGNGIVLEVKFGSEVYAVKKTAFRWREVLIMPKLRHKNILKLVAMLIGKSVPDQPKRRLVYQFSTKMTNDLGRCVGSFEKHCFRTLLERYRAEPLLLSKIDSNFRYVAHEVLSALEYLHSRPYPIVHRDVKISNILVEMACDCHNPLVCVCRQRPSVVLGDFDASLELRRDGTLEPDPPRATSFGPTGPATKIYHVSAVGTLGYKSPEGSMYCVGNSPDVMPPLSTKADIFGFGLVMSLLFLNQEGPKHLRGLSQLLLAVNLASASTGTTRTLNEKQKDTLRKNGITIFRPVEIAVTPEDNDRILPLGRARRELNNPQIIDFLGLCLEPDPKHRASAKILLNHPYLSQIRATTTPSSASAASQRPPQSSALGTLATPRQRSLSTRYSSSHTKDDPVKALFGKGMKDSL